MSGFVGILNLDGKPIDSPLLADMTRYMAFRGPDAQHTWYDDHVGMGHALLCTAFESQHEQQPCSLNGQVRIVADARVDGRRELVGKLRASGREVSLVLPDVELILHAYHIWGMDCLAHLIGDFAFAIWDPPRHRLFCARDQFGVVPFFYARLANTFIVSNTLNCIRMHPDYAKELNDQALADSILFTGNREFDTTFFKGIYKLPPAHSLILEDGTVHTQRYWNLPERGEYIRYKQPEEYVENFGVLFRQAVSDRLRTDRLATELTGGMDTTSIAVTAHKQLSEQSKQAGLKAFTIAFRWLVPEKEGDYAARVAKDLGIDHHIVLFEDHMESVPARCPDFVPPEPTGTMLNRANYVHAKEASLHSRLLFTGEGGDPSLAPSPYRWCRLPPTRRMGGMLCDFVNHARVFGVQPPRPMGSSLKRRLKNWQGRTDPQTRPFPDWLNPDLVSRLHLYERKMAIDASHSLHDQQRRLVESPLWSNHFVHADPGYTGLQLKRLYPFFDVRLLGYLLDVPPVPWLQHKALLRLAMREQLPEYILQRPKVPLTRNTNVAHSYALCHEVQPWQLDLAMDPVLAPYVNQDRLVSRLRSPESISHGSYRQVLAAVHIAYWLRHQTQPASR